MSTNVQILRELPRWNVFEFRDNKYVPVYPFALDWFDAHEKLLHANRFWCKSSPDSLNCYPVFLCSSFVVLPFGCGTYGISLKAPSYISKKELASNVAVREFYFNS